MKFDVASFEFSAILAPGGVVMLALILTFPQALREYDGTVLIAIGIIGSFVFGHVIAAVGGLYQEWLGAALHDLEAMSFEQWREQGYYADFQIESLERFVTSFEISMTLADDANIRKLVLKRMQMLAPYRDRLANFKRLVSGARGLTISFVISAFVFAWHLDWGYAVGSVALAATMVERHRRFQDALARELVQQTLLPNCLRPSAPIGGF